MSFDTLLFNEYMDYSIGGIATGFVIGFIAWGVGFAFYSIIKWVKIV